MPVTVTPEGLRSASGFKRFDATHLLHPSTRMDELSADNVLIVSRAQGVRIWDVDGNKWLDGFSGLLNVSLGYGRPKLPPR